MKANNIPDKIYLSDFGTELSHDWHTEHCYEKDIEYTRTDALIEKAVNFLNKEENLPLWSANNGAWGCDTSQLVKDFVNYMKGE